jgi:thioredoxin-dependent peroxiredoxin
VQTVRFRAGETIISEGAAGDTAFAIVTGSAEVSVGRDDRRRILGTLEAGDVFGEMSLVDPGPRSATVRALTDLECRVTSYADFLASAEADPGQAIRLMQTLVRRLRQTNERIARIDPDTGHRIQQWLSVILAGLDEQDALSPAEMDTLQRELRMLLQIEHFRIATAEVDKAEQVLAYMLRPSMEECLNLWFGKIDATDQEIWTRFGADVALASRGHYDHWALNLEHPRLLVALVIMLDQFRRNMYRETAEMYACDARCLALVKRGLRVGVARRLKPVERVFLCLALTHSESLEDQQLCMEEWGRVMHELAPDDPLNAFHEIFHRHLAVIMRFGRFPHRNKVLERAGTPAEQAFLDDASFRFDLPLVRQPDGTLAFAGAVTRRVVKLFDHEYQTLLPAAGEAAPGSFEFAYRGPDAAFTRARDQLRRQGFVRIGDTVPDFTAHTSTGPIRFHEYIGDGWCVLFSHPADFTPVCTTELGASARLEDEWRKRDTRIIGLSVDAAEDHQRWIADINETQHTRVNFPIIADKDRRVSMLFGMLDATHFGHGAGLGETMAVRSVFVISPAKRVELILTYPAYVGRNFDEILRVIDALQLSAKYRVATPANWRPGEDTVVLPFISDEEAERIYADQGGVRTVRSYLRYVRDPSLRML